MDQRLWLAAIQHPWARDGLEKLQQRGVLECLAPVEGVGLVRNARPYAHSGACARVHACTRSIVARARFVKSSQVK